MDQIGVGDCQTHQLLWWQARIRNCVRDVEDNGGRLESQRIHPALLQSIREGKVGSLYLDEVSHQVCCRQHYQQQPRQRPRQQPPPPTPQPPPTPPQGSAFPFAAGFGNLYVPGQASPFPRGFHPAGAEGVGHGAGGSGVFRPGMGSYDHGHGSGNGSGNGRHVPMPQAGKGLYVDTHGHGRIDARPPADGPILSPQNVALHNFGGGAGGGVGRGPESPMEHSPSPPAPGERPLASQQYGLNPNAMHYRDHPAQPNPHHQQSGGRQFSRQEQGQYPQQGQGAWFGDGRPQTQTTTAPPWRAASAAAVTPLPAQTVQTAQMNETTRRADARITGPEQLQPAVASSMRGAAATQPPPDSHAVGGNSSRSRSSTPSAPSLSSIPPAILATMATPLPSKVGSADGGRPPAHNKNTLNREEILRSLVDREIKKNEMATKPRVAPPQQQESSKKPHPQDFHRTEPQPAATPRSPPPQEQENSEEPHPPDIQRPEAQPAAKPRAKADTRWPSVLRDALDDSQQLGQAESQPDPPRPVEQDATDPSESLQHQQQELLLAGEGVEEGGTVGQEEMSEGVRLGVRSSPPPEEEGEKRQDQDHRVRQDTNQAKPKAQSKMEKQKQQQQQQQQGAWFSGRLVLPRTKAKVPHRQLAVEQPGAVALKAALADSRSGLRKPELLKPEPRKLEARVGAGTYAEATSGGKRATADANGASSQTTAGSQPENAEGASKLTLLSMLRKKAKKNTPRREGEGEWGVSPTSSAEQSPVAATGAPIVTFTPITERIDAAAPPSPTGAEAGWGSSTAGGTPDESNGDGDDDGGSGIRCGGTALDVSAATSAPQEAKSAEASAGASAAGGERKIQAGDGDGGRSGSGTLAVGPTLDVSAAAFAPQEATGPASPDARKSPLTELFEAAKATVGEIPATPPSSAGTALFQAVRAATANDAAVAAVAGRHHPAAADPLAAGAAVNAPPAPPSAAASALYQAASDAVRAPSAPPAPPSALYEAVLAAATGSAQTVRIRSPASEEDAEVRADPLHLQAWFECYRSSGITPSAPPSLTQHQESTSLMPPVVAPSTPTGVVPPSARGTGTGTGTDTDTGPTTDAPSTSASPANLSGSSGHAAAAAGGGPTAPAARVAVAPASDQDVAPVHGYTRRVSAAVDDSGTIGVASLQGPLQDPAGDNDNDHDHDYDKTDRDEPREAGERVNFLSGGAEQMPRHPDPDPVGARAASFGADVGVDLDTGPADYVLVHEESSFADAVAALGIEARSGERGGGGGSGRLGAALRGAGAVGVRLDGVDLGAENGAISTIQVRGEVAWYTGLCCCRCRLPTSSWQCSIFLAAI